MTRIIVGLSQHSSGASFIQADFKYGLDLSTVAFDIMEDGVSVLQDQYIVTPDTIGSIIYDGTSIKYYIDGILKYTSSVLHTGPLYAYGLIPKAGKFKNFHVDQLLVGPTGFTGFTG